MANMKKDVEVFIIVICDQEPNKAPSPELVSSVRKQIEKIDGILDTSLDIITADIGASALLEEEKIPQMVAEIKQIDGVDKVETKILVPIKKS